MARLPRLPRVAVGHRGPIIGIDVETASPAHGAVCSVGVSVVLGTRVIGEEHWFTDPKTEFHPRFVAIHGITPAKVAGRPPLARLWPEVEAFIRRTVASTVEPSLFSPPPELDGDASDLGPHPAAPALHVAHNAPFDRLQLDADRLHGRHVEAGVSTARPPRPCDGRGASGDRAAASRCPERCPGLGADRIALHPRRRCAALNAAACGGVDALPQRSWVFEGE